MSLLAGFCWGVASLGLGMAGNRLIWRFAPKPGTIWFVPIWEELAKTSIGAMCDQLLIVHAVFGLGEAVYEAGKRQWRAGGFALASHVGFGMLTYLGRRLTGYWAPGWFLAVGAHIIWNWFVLRYINP